MNIKFSKYSGDGYPVNIKALDAALKAAFSSIKHEFGVHLDSINQNTSEIESLYEYVAEIDAKIEKLNERLDELQMFLNPVGVEQQFSVELSHREQEVFLILYSEERVSLGDVAKRLGFTEEMVNRYVFSLISKGVPVLRQFVGGELFLYLELKFKDLQAKKNVLNIDESISRHLMGEEQI